MTSLDTLVDALLYEGYALYPYTPGAAKNSTPTPFGIVYPAAYAAETSGAFGHLQLECILAGAADANVAVTVRFLQATGPGHEAKEGRVDVSSEGPVAMIDAPPLDGRVMMDLTQLTGGLGLLTVRVENLTPCRAGADRAEALGRALISTHVVARTGGGRFVSPLAAAGPEGVAVAACRNVNTWPVLATPEDDTVLGAAIVLPDHPEIAPESRGSLFDGTEIEEALLLHVLALSDGERDEIAAGDPAVRAMVERAAAATPGEVLRLHGRLVMTDSPEPNAARGAIDATP